MRHLTIAFCDFDDECADVLGSCPAFGNLTRLVLDQVALSTNAAKQLLRSPNLQRLVELQVKPPYGEARVAFGKAVEVLLDQTVMPLLSGGWLEMSGVAEGTIERLKAGRPALVIYQ